MGRKSRERHVNRGTSYFCTIDKLLPSGPHSFWQGRYGTFGHSFNFSFCYFLLFICKWIGNCGFVEWSRFDEKYRTSDKLANLAESMGKNCYVLVIKKLYVKEHKNFLWKSLSLPTLFVTNQQCEVHKIIFLISKSIFVAVY